MALARVSGVDYLVSGDPHLTEASLDDPTVTVLTPRRFSEMLEEPGRYGYGALGKNRNVWAYDLSYQIGQRIYAVTDLIEARELRLRGCGHPEGIRV